MRNLKAFVASALTGCAFLASSAIDMSQAQDYPSQPLVWIAPSSAGSGFDVVARIVAPKLSEVLGTSVIVENITGAGGTIGAARAAEANPDGYTVLMVNINHTSAEALRTDLTYNLLESFEPVIRFAASYYVYIVHPDVEATTLDEFVALAKERPDDFNVANAGIGSATFMSGEYFKARAGIDIQHITYEGGGPALAAVVSGETQFYGSPIETARPFIEDGSVRALAVSSAERHPLLPDVPAVSESIEGFEFMSWFGLVFPKDTPTEFRDKLRAAMAETLADPNVKRRLEDDLGLDILDEGPEEFAAFLENEVAILKDLVAAAGIEPQ